MTRPSLRAANAVALLLGACATFSALAADPVTDAMQDAYAPYRTALFKTNGASQAESQQAMTQAQQSWARLSAQFGTAPPAPYDRDAAFAASLAEVAKVYARAAEQISANQLAAAHETLEHARDIMAEVRRRNQVIVYSDHMNAYHAEMELVINDGSKVLAQPNGIPQLTATAGALGYLAGRLTTEAPEKYAKNEEFVSLAKAVQKSVSDLQAALFAQDAPAAKAAIQKLKAPYGKLFLKFG
jgi:hypothetical protein